MDVTPEIAAAIRSYTSAVLRSRAAYAEQMASPADRAAAEQARRLRKHASDRARYRARKKGTAA